MLELTLYHYKARAYSPTLGRFLQTDPTGDDDGLNLYAYVGNDPVNGVDPTGMSCTGTRTDNCNDGLAKGASGSSTGGDTTLKKSMSALSDVGRGITRGYLQSLAGITADPGGVISTFAPEYSLDNLILGSISSQTEANSLLGYKGVEAVASIVTGTGIGKSIASAGAISKGLTMNPGRTTVKGLEFSHWIPNRMGGPRSLWNGNFVTPRTHALSDPKRYQFMSRAWKDVNVPWLFPVQQAARVPYSVAGASAGLAYGLANMFGD